MRCACQLGRRPDMKASLMYVPVYDESFDAAAETILSCLCMECWQSPTVCRACMQIKIVGNTFAAFRFVALSPMCLA